MNLHFKLYVVADSKLLQSINTKMMNTCGEHGVDASRHGVDAQRCGEQHDPVDGVGRKDSDDVTAATAAAGEARSH